MCRTTAYKSTSCGHRWLTITTRCGPNVGFATTPVHEFRCHSTILGRPNFLKAPAGTCPNCDLKGQYNGNTTRMVLGNGSRQIQRNMLKGIGLGGEGPTVVAGASEGNYGRQYPAHAGIHPQAFFPQPGMAYGSIHSNYQQTLACARRNYPVAQKYSYGVTRPSEPSCIIM